MFKRIFIVVDQHPDGTPICLVIHGLVLDQEIAYEIIELAGWKDNTFFIQVEDDDDVLDAPIGHQAIDLFLSPDGPYCYILGSILHFN